MNDESLHTDDTFTPAEQTQMPNAREEEALRQALRRQHTPTPDIDAAWADFVKKNHIMTPTAQESKSTSMKSFTSAPIRKSNSAQRWWTIAAAVVLIAVLGITSYLWQRPSEIDSEPQQVFAHIDEAAEVLLTDRSSGKAIALEETQIIFDAEKANRKVPTEVEPRQLTLRVPRGTTYQLTLPDGTEVWLNSDSELSFPDHFTGKERLVKLVGEGYFKVAKDKEHPFRIKAPNFSTLVLGTEFNIRAYDCDASIVSLVSGSVSLHSVAAPVQTGDNNPVLKPGQTATIGVDGSIRIEELDAYSFIQWKENLFYFNNSPLQDVIREMGRWYNVDIFIENPEVSNDLHVHFAADRSESLQTALDNLNELGLIQATLDKENARVSVRLLEQHSSDNVLNLHN